MKKVCCLIIAFFIAGISVNAQKTDKADKYYYNGEYFKAIERYKKELPYIDLNKKFAVLSRIAECYYKLKLYSQAALYYNDAITAGYPDNRIYLELGKAYLYSGDYKRSITAVNKYMKYFPEDEKAAEMLRMAREASETNKKKYSFSSSLPFFNERAVNTEYSEHNPSWLGDGIVYSSGRKSKSSDKINDQTGEYDNSLYFAVKIGSVYGESSKIKVNIPARYKVLAFTYDEVNSAGYIVCQNNKHGNDKTFLAEVAVRTQPDAVYIKQFRKMPFDENYNYWQPVISTDGNALYFVSDMPGGKGGKDIWMSGRLMTGGWGMPVNLDTPVNSEYDDSSPYVMGDSLLFFASERQSGYGGLDIYISKREGEQWSEPLLLNYPFNSSSDDFGIIVNKNFKGGVFCSNRTGGAGNSDLYSFTGSPFIVNASGVIKDALSGLAVENCAVVFKGNKCCTDTVFSDSEGYYEFDGLKAGETYSIEYIRDGYVKDNISLTVPANTTFKSFNTKTGYALLDVVMYPEPAQSFIIKGIVADRHTGNSLPGAILYIKSAGKNVYEDVTVADSTGMFRFKIYKKDNYLISAFKEGYLNELNYLDINEVNAVTDKLVTYNYNFKLTNSGSRSEVIFDSVDFEKNSVSLGKSAKSELKRLALMLKANPGIRIQISSHSDARINPDYNLMLTGTRAVVVARYLESLGIDRRRLLPRGYGSYYPLVKNYEYSDKPFPNCRTSFKILQVMPLKNYYANGQNEEVNYSVLITSSSKEIDQELAFSKIMRNISGIKINKEKAGSVNYYYAGSFKSLPDAVAIKDKCIDLGYAESILTAFIKGRRVGVGEAIRLSGYNIFTSPL